MDDLRSAVGTWTSLSDPAVAEIAAGGGFDFVVVDTEHAPLGIETVADCLRATGECPGFVRVPANDPVRIKRLLDLGPDGLVVPLVDTAEEAQAAVAATRYPPDGVRGVAAARAADYGRSIESYVREGHRRLTVVIQIERPTAVENAAAIAAVDGVDALFVGPADLSASLGAFGRWDDPDLLSAFEDVLAAGAAADVPVGTLGTTADRIRSLGSLGFDFLIAGTDVAHLLDGQRRAVEAARDVV